MKVWEYIAVMSKGRIPTNKISVKNFLVENNKIPCSVENELFDRDLSNSTIYKTCNNFKKCKDCLEKYLEMEIKVDEM